MSNNYLINKAHVKAYVLECVTMYRAEWGANRVAKEFMDDLNERVRSLIRGSVKRHASKRKTVKDLF
jgi:hypothetical protein